MYHQIDDIGEFRKLDKGMVADLDRMLAIDIPALLKQVRHRCIYMHT
jgi:hypothetical protein